MSKEEDRNWLLEEYLTVMSPIDPDAPENRRKEAEAHRNALVQAQGLSTCSTEHLHYLVFGN